MAQYYYLATSLPPLLFPAVPELSFDELHWRLEVNLTSRDLRKVQVLRRWIDIGNIRLLLAEQPIDPKGNLGAAELQEALTVQAVLPEYVFDFWQKRDRSAERLRDFAELLAHFLVQATQEESGFLRSYFQFEREARLVMLVHRAKRLHRDLGSELQFEDPTDPFVAYLLAQKDAERFEPPEEYRELRDLMEGCGPDPWQQHKAFAEYRFKRMEEMVAGTQTFHTDRVLLYVAQLMLLEQWHSLDEAQGRIQLESFTKR